MRAFDLHVVPAGKHDAAASARTFAFVALVLLGTTIALGEVAALQVLYTNEPSEEAATLVRRGLVFAGAYFGVIQLVILRKLLDPLTRRQQGIAWGLAAVMVAAHVYPAWVLLV